MRIVLHLGFVYLLYEKTTSDYLRYFLNNLGFCYLIGNSVEIILIEVPKYKGNIIKITTNISQNTLHTKQKHINFKTAS